MELPKCIEKCNYGYPDQCNCNTKFMCFNCEKTSGNCKWCVSKEKNSDGKMVTYGRCISANTFDDTKCPPDLQVPNIYDELNGLCYTNSTESTTTDSSNAETTTEETTTEGTTTEGTTTESTTPEAFMNYYENNRYRSNIAFILFFLLFIVLIVNYTKLLKMRF